MEVGIIVINLISMKIQLPMLVLALFFLSVAGCKKSDPGPDPESMPESVTDVFYNQGDTSSRHTLDIYYYQNAEPGKVLFFVPGGAWRQGDKDQYVNMATMLRNYYHLTVVTINYRLSDSAQGSAIHPDHIRDVASAFGWVRRNISTYGGNPEQIYIFGQSAGAHLASLLATDSLWLNAEGCSLSDIKGVISMSGTYMLENLVTFPANPLGLSYSDVLMYRVIVGSAFGSTDPVILEETSPAMQLHSRIPPFLVIHTELDMPGFSKENENFASLLQTTGSGHTVEIHKLLQTDYSPETWALATSLAAAEPALADYIGHYAEVVAINEQDRSKGPTTWIVNFIQNH